MTKNRVTGMDIERSTGFQALRWKIRLLTSYNIFLDNADELTDSVRKREGFELPQNLASLGGAHSFDLIGSMKTNENVFRPVLRHLQNFVQSALSLRNLTYKVRDFCEKHGESGEIRARPSEVFAGNPKRAFIQGLRDAYSHGDYLWPVFRTDSRKVRGRMVMETYFCFQKDNTVKRIEEWKKVTALSKEDMDLVREYVESWNKNERLATIVNDYRKDIVGYYTWLFDYYDRFFLEEFRKKDELIRKWLAQSWR